MTTISYNKLGVDFAEGGNRSIRTKTLGFRLRSTNLSRAGVDPGTLRLETQVMNSQSPNKTSMLQILIALAFTRLRVAELRFHRTAEPLEDAR